MSDKKETTDIYGALFAVQTTVDVVRKTADNPFFKSKYADLPAVWIAVKDALKENHLVVYHRTLVKDGSDILETIVRHVPSGTFIQSESQLHLQKPTSQEYGSCVTYMRRYAISALLGLVTDDDDDGNDSNQKPKKEAEKKTEKKEPAKTEVKPVDGNEFLIMQNGVKSAADMDALKTEWSKIAVAIKSGRMTDAQVKALEKEKNKRKLDLDEIPTEWGEDGRPKQ